MVVPVDYDCELSLLRNHWFRFRAACCSRNSHRASACPRIPISWMPIPALRLRASTLFPRPRREQGCKSKFIGSTCNRQAFSASKCLLSDDNVIVQFWSVRADGSRCTAAGLGLLLSLHPFEEISR